MDIKRILISVLITIDNAEMDAVQLQHDINALLEWSKLWLLSFNISKCKHLRIGLQSHSIA